MASPSESTAVSGLPTTDANATSTNYASPESILSMASMLLMEARLVFTALAVIYLGAHGALRRPPSASPPKGKDGKPGKREKNDTFSDGFVASDAILFPVMAGFVLVGLYYLLKWLQDPTILNKILRTYVSAMGIASMGKLVADALQILTSFVFPKVWRDRNGHLFRVDQRRRAHVKLKSPKTEEIDHRMTTPLPGQASRWSLSSRTNSYLWEIRHLLLGEWTLRVAVHGIGKGTFKIKLANIVGALAGSLIAYIYHITNSSLLANIVALGTCYGAFMIMSCTSFSVGSLVLLGLFVYDIVMVFFTPFMITVATKIDAPIKLVFEGESRASLLGLGDIVIPGIFICLALRFDLYRQYQKRIKYVPTELETVTQSDSSENTVTATQTEYRAVKAPFYDPQGVWGEWWWTRRTASSKIQRGIPRIDRSKFSKPYFYATLAGYTLGLITTLAVLLTFNHGQPALLYLVPGVVGAAWLTGLLRGELHEMWTYTEDGSLDTRDVVVELDGNGKVVKEIKEKSGSDEEKKAEDSHNEGDGAEDSKTKVSKDDNNESGSEAASDEGHDVFLISLKAPGLADDDYDED
ncbi:Signal peptide peptidase [Pleurostoma richardsiae]|uniref:Signal peptide peptidase n=1 Tax=Pleurostoma richardsiae TaxID=41990 RepID=A0AA38VJ83_9PEZI|nr:Signal peptide peptidase [Pleurostoma richardsiae]